MVVVVLVGPVGWGQLLGTRRLVRQVIATAVHYYVGFADQVDHDADWSARVGADLRIPWENEQTSIDWGCRSTPLTSHSSPMDSSGGEFQ